MKALVKGTDEIVTIMGMIGTDENGIKCYQTMVSDYGVCSVYSEDELEFIN